MIECDWCEGRAEWKLLRRDWFAELDLACDEHVINLVRTHYWNSGVYHPIEPVGEQ